MPLYRYGGTILKRAAFGNKLANSSACCCTRCCACDTLNDWWALNNTLVLRISGAITATCTMGKTTDAAACTVWVWEDSGDCSSYTESCALILQNSHFFCPAAGTNLTDYRFESRCNNAGCGFEDEVGDPAPVFNAANAAKYATEITCDEDFTPGVDTPTSTWPFYAKFVFPLEELQLNGCSTCDTQDVTFEVSLA